LINGHFETIYPALFRKVSGKTPQTERITTHDEDFLDLDWYGNAKNTLVIISHGLEGNSRKPYMLGMVKAIISHIHADVLTWNYRGCSGEMNKANRFYHSGATEDLDLVVNHSLTKGYKSIALIGFSLGGNLTLKYVGENGKNLDSRIKAAVAFSVPIDLEASSLKMKKWENYLYSRRFLKTLKKKISEKESLKSKNLALDELGNIKNLFHFDDLFTGPLHGFKDAKDYYRSCSSQYFLDSIDRPTLIVNAKNDPFLSESCFPYNLLEKHEWIEFEAPEHGGHCGFADFRNKAYWSEKRAVDFLKPIL
jgi:predicted alpha/beta-fold hydrolase